MSSPTGTVIDNVTPALARAWHVVATSAEVGADPVQVWLLGEPWCLVRMPDGRIGAWYDRCPHRLAPLSAGCLVGDELQCGYHGWRFATGGRCQAIPSIGDRRPPERAVARVPWGVDEGYGLVWLAPELPVSERHPFPEWDDPAFVATMSEIVRTTTGAALLVDNFLDAAHFPFVHAATFGVDEAAEVHDRGVNREGWEVSTVFETWYREQGSVQRQLLAKTGSASLTVKLRLDFPETGTCIAILFCCTPEKRGQTRVYKALAHNGLGDDPDRRDRFVADEDQILREDLSILERYDHEEVFLDRTVELHTKADRLSLAWRGVMADLVAEIHLSGQAVCVPHVPPAPNGISLSSHILDTAEGGGRAGVNVEVIDNRGTTVGSGVTDETGRIAALAGGLEPGVYQIRWEIAGAFVIAASVTVNLAEVKHYHVPLLASDHSATVYLGA